MHTTFDIAAITRIFGQQDQYQHVVRATSSTERLHKLKALRTAIVSHVPDLIAALAGDIGKPAFEAAGEAVAILGEIDITIDNLEQWMKPVDVAPGPQAAPGASARIIREPKGQVLIFGPWNFPFSLLFQPLVGAIAAGNVCIVKPSELTPRTSALSARLIRAVFDEREVAIFEGGASVATSLLEHPFDHIFFTGSTKVGKLVMAAAAKHLCSLTLELGGKSPVIIDDDVDLAHAARRIAWGKFLNAGQICLAPDHVWIKRAQRDAFVDAVTAYVRQSFYPNGTLHEADFGQIVDTRNLERLTYLIGDAVGRGAQVALGGKACGGRRIEPTILVDVPPAAAIMAEEVFGPIMPILTYDNLDDVISDVRGRGKPLALYIFSRRQEFIDAVLSRTSSGGATVNDVIRHAAERNLPFGGVGPSGMGTYHGMYSFLAFTHQRSVYCQAAENPMETFAHPPYVGKLEALKTNLLR